jgi:hypothetical protein
MPTPAHEVFEAFWRAPSSYDRRAKVGTGIDRALGGPRTRRRSTAELPTQQQTG